MARRRILAMLTGAVLAILAGASPGRAWTGGDTVRLDVATQVGEHYVGWRVRLPEAGTLLARAAGVSEDAGSLGIWVISAGDAGGGGALPQPTYDTGTDGERTSAPGVTYSLGGGAYTGAGDYLVVAGLTGGAGAVAAVELRGPATATVVGRFTGRAWGFADGDFTEGGHALVGPGVDRRSIHGQVAIEVQHTLFAAVRTASSRSTGVTVTAPDGTVSEPLVVAHGPSGAWTFRLDVERDEVATVDSLRDHRTYIDAFDVPVSLLAAAS